MEEGLPFECPKCQSTECETGQIRVSGGGWSAYFNLDNRRFETASCANCGYTEIYKRRRVGTLGQIFDLFGGR